MENKEETPIIQEEKSAEEHPEHKPEQEPAVDKRKQELQEAKTETEKGALTAETEFLSPTVDNQAYMVAKRMIHDKAVPEGIKSVEQMRMILMAGHNMGMDFTESVHSLYMVNGAVSIYGKAIPRQLRRNGYKVKYADDMENFVCRAYVWSGDWDNPDEYYEDYASFDEAQQSGYTKDNKGGTKFGWKAGRNIRLKLRYQALDTLIRTHLPEVYSGVTTVESVAEDVQEMAENREKNKAKIENAGAMMPSADVSPDEVPKSKPENKPEEKE